MTHISTFVLKNANRKPYIPMEPRIWDKSMKQITVIYDN
jgi:hypothetical protein